MDSRIWLPTPLILGFLVGEMSRPSTWYNNLRKPALNPPKYVFPIAWTILYILMGVSFYLGSKATGSSVFPAIHLGLNLLYSPLFFKYKQILLSAILTTIILVTAAMLYYQFSITPGGKLASQLLIPYLAWLCFANYLAWSVYFKNRQ